MATNTIGSTAELATTMKQAGQDLEKSQTALIKAFKSGADATTLEGLKLEFQEKSQKFQAFMAIFDVLQRVKDQIIQRIGRIGN